jgi:NTE family protein
VINIPKFISKLSKFNRLSRSSGFSIGFNIRFNELFKKIIKITIILTICITLISGCARIKFDFDRHPQYPPVANFVKKDVALVLGGGGSKGLAHLGVLEELEQVGIVPDVIIGCSSGAIVGSLYAANPNAAELKKFLLKGKRSDVLEVNIADWPYSVYSTNKLKKYLRKYLKVRTFEQLKIPFVATATNLQYGDLVSFSTGDLINPVAASAAYPGAFFPPKLYGQYCVDCGVADPIPVRVAKQLGFKKVIAVNISNPLSTSPPNNLFGLLKRSTEILYINHTKYAVEEADLVIDLHFESVDVFTDQQNHYLYRAGQVAAKRAIPQILSLLKK